MAANRTLLRKARALTIEQVEQAIGLTFQQWACQCHAISLAIVKARLFDYARVARGTCDGVGGQHSWVVLNEDPYDPDAVIVDPTLWSYDKSVEGIWVGTAHMGKHVPHGGSGSVWTWGKPSHQGGETVLINREGLSEQACRFLDMIEPLDRRGWMEFLSYCPVAGWPAREIVMAAQRTPQLHNFTPIDRIGMLTDLNPGGLYLPGEEKALSELTPLA